MLRVVSSLARCAGMPLASDPLTPVYGVCGCAGVGACPVVSIG